MDELLQTFVTALSKAQEVDGNIYDPNLFTSFGQQFALHEQTYNFQNVPKDILWSIASSLQCRLVTFSTRAEWVGTLYWKVVEELSQRTRQALQQCQTCDDLLSLDLASTCALYLTSQFASKVTLQSHFETLSCQFQEDGAFWIQKLFWVKMFHFQAKHVPEHWLFGWSFLSWTLQQRTSSAWIWLPHSFRTCSLLHDYMKECVGSRLKEFLQSILQSHQKFDAFFHPPKHSEQASKLFHSLLSQKEETVVEQPEVWNVLESRIRNIRSRQLEVEDKMTSETHLIFSSSDHSGTTLQKIEQYFSDFEKKTRTSCPKCSAYKQKLSSSEAMTILQKPRLCSDHQYISNVDSNLRALSIPNSQFARYQYMFSYMGFLVRRFMFVIDSKQYLIKTVEVAKKEHNKELCQLILKEEGINLVKTVSSQRCYSLLVGLWQDELFVELLRPVIDEMVLQNAQFSGALTYFAEMVTLRSFATQFKLGWKTHDVCVNSRRCATLLLRLPVQTLQQHTAVLEIQFYRRRLVDPKVAMPQYFPSLDFFSCYLDLYKNETKYLLSRTKLPCVFEHFFGSKTPPHSAFSTRIKQKQQQELLQFFQTTTTPSPTVACTAFASLLSKELKPATSSSSSSSFFMPMCSPRSLLVSNLETVHDSSVLIPSSLVLGQQGQLSSSSSSTSLWPQVEQKAEVDSEQQVAAHVVHRSHCHSSSLEQIQAQTAIYLTNQLVPSRPMVPKTPHLFLVESLSLMPMTYPMIGLIQHLYTTNTTTTTKMYRTWSTFIDALSVADASLQVPSEMLPLPPLLSLSLNKIENCETVLCQQLASTSMLGLSPAVEKQNGQYCVEMETFEDGTCCFHLIGEVPGELPLVVEDQPQAHFSFPTPLSSEMKDLLSHRIRDLLVFRLCTTEGRQQQQLEFYSWLETVFADFPEIQKLLYLYPNYFGSIVSNTLHWMERYDTDWLVFRREKKELRTTLPNSFFTDQERAPLYVTAKHSFAYPFHILIRSTWFLTFPESMIKLHTLLKGLQRLSHLNVWPLKQQTAAVEEEDLDNLSDDDDDDDDERKCGLSELVRMFHISTKQVDQIHSRVPQILAKASRSVEEQQFLQAARFVFLLKMSPWCQSQTCLALQRRTRMIVYPHDVGIAWMKCVLPFTRGPLFLKTKRDPEFLPQRSKISTSSSSSTSQTSAGRIVRFSHLSRAKAIEHATQIGFPLAYCLNLERPKLFQLIRQYEIEKRLDPDFDPGQVDMQQFLKERCQFTNVKIFDTLIHVLCLEFQQVYRALLLATNASCAPSISLHSSSKVLESKNEQDDDDDFLPPPLPLATDFQVLEIVSRTYGSDCSIKTETVQIASPYDLLLCAELLRLLAASKTKTTLSTSATVCQCDFETATPTDLLQLANAVFDAACRNYASCIGSVPSALANHKASEILGSRPIETFLNFDLWIREYTNFDNVFQSIELFQPLLVSKSMHELFPSTKHLQYGDAFQTLSSNSSSSSSLCHPVLYPSRKRKANTKLPNPRTIKQQKKK